MPPKRRRREFKGTPRFQVVRLIGEGGIGLVYEAMDREDSTRVAIKTLQTLDSDGLLRFKNEFRLLQGLHHTNLVRLGELFEHEGEWFFTMELLDGIDFMSYVAPGAAGPRNPGQMSDTALQVLNTATSRLEAGPSLRQVIAEGRAFGNFEKTIPEKTIPEKTIPEKTIPEKTIPERRYRGHTFDEARVRSALEQLTEGLIVLHEAGKVHRDIKPQNVMVIGDRVVVLDFGLVREDSGEHGLENGLVLGTPAYMSPEQAIGEPSTPASDWYGVGVMLYEALVGERPFEGSPGQIMMAKQAADAKLPPDVAESAPADLVDLCHELLRRDPAERPTGPEVLTRLTGKASAPRLRAVTESQLTEHLRSDTPLVGREALLGTLMQAFEERGHGQPVAVFVHGSSGMGKTALIDKMAVMVRDYCPGALVLRGHCYERESVPYKAFDGIVDALTRHLMQPNVGAEFLVPPRIDTLVRLFPVLKGIPKPIGLPASPEIPDLHELRREAFAALKELFSRVAAKWPLVVMIDDLQWGDQDSAALLTEVLSPPSPPGMLFVTGYRSEESDNPLVRSLREAITAALPGRLVREIEVGPLRPEDCRRLAKTSLAALGAEKREDARALIETIVRESAGSPFFVRELVRHLAAEAVGSPEIAADFSTGGKSAGLLEEVLAARRRRLDEDARALLDVVAVAGQPIAQGVVVDAAGLDSKKRSVFGELRAEHLVRTRGPGSKDAVECYHDRIREAVVASLDPDALRDINRRLAAALEASGSGDAEILANCHLGAGNHTRAAEYARKAADNAERALAFDRAAHMYRMVLDIGRYTEGQERAMRVHLGQALVNAGRGNEAAVEFLAAAYAAPGDRCIELKSMAAEQLLRSGSIDQGLDLLEEVLTACKLYVPRTDQGALVSLGLNRARLRLRGLGYTSRASGEVDARRLRQLDICWAGAVGLGMVDPVRGSDFGTRCLLMALGTGDETRIARTLAMEAALLATVGGKSTARAEAMAEKAAEMARRIDDHHAQGLSIFASGAAALCSGRWQTALDEARRADAVLRKYCTGVAWEMTSLRTLQFGALYYLGDWGTMNERASVALRQALERSDLYMVASLVTYATFGRLAADDVDGAWRTIRNATVKWSLSGYHVQHYLNLVSRIHTDLYEGQIERAWQRLQSEWQEMSRSLLRRVQLLRIEMHHWRARCALAYASEQDDSSARADLLRLVAADTRRVEREHMPWATPLAVLLRATLAACRGHDEQAVKDLETAAAGLEDEGMQLFAASARYRLGQLVGGSRGDELKAGAQASMSALGIANPVRLIDSLAPGFPMTR